MARNPVNSLYMRIHSLAILISTSTLAAQPQSLDLPYWPESARPAYIQYETALNATPTRESLLAWHQHFAKVSSRRHRTSQELARDGQ